MDSILTSIKKMLGIEEEYEQFDADIIMHINTAFSELWQVGVGASKDFAIEDKSYTWKEFIQDNDVQFEAVKTYVYLSVKLRFDPPLNSSHLAAMERDKDRLEFRLSIAADSNGEEENQNGA